MHGTDTDYDFEDSVLRELRAAQARLSARRATPASAGRRRLRRLPLTAAAAAMLAAAAAGGVTALSTHPRNVPAPAARPWAVASVTAKLTASLGGEAGFLITSHVTQASTGERLTSWIDAATGSRRLLLTNAAGTPRTAEGIVLRGTNATVTTLDYATRTATTQTEPAAVIQSAQRLGVNVPSPADIRRELSSAAMVGEGQAEVDGHRTYRIRMTVPPASQAWFRGDDVELYVDASTYLLIRTTISHQGTQLDTDDLTWTPRAAADLSLARLTVPAGFTRS